MKRATVINALRLFFPGFEKDEKDYAEQVAKHF